MEQPYRKRTVHGHANADTQGHVLEHILVAEAALGKSLPTGAHVHHVDGNGLNNAPKNLVICQDAAYHKLLHYRTRIVRAGGNPNTDKFCSDCGQLKSLDAFNLRSTHKSGGRQSICRACQKLRFHKYTASLKESA